MRILLPFLLHFIPLLALTQAPGLQWSRQFGYASREDVPHTVDVDLEGNVYIIGKISPNGDQRIRIAKYNASGALLWSTSYDTELQYSYPILRDVDVDSVGNTVVLIYGIYNNNESYMVMRKYNTLGALLWSVVQRPESSGIAPVALDVDKLGNIFVVSDNHFFPVSPTKYVTDLLVQKFNKNGILSWGTLYRGSGNGDDHAGDIIVDNAGYSYVAATTVEKDTRSQIPSVRTTLLKFGTTGSLLWKKQPSTVGAFRSSKFILNFDAAGYLYFTGQQSEYSHPYRFFVGKYSISGTEQFLAIRNGVAYVPISATVDAAGNTYVANVVTGPGVTWYNVEVHKFNTAGVHLWNTVYNSGDSTYDWNADIALDASGNIYVAGQSGPVKPTQFFPERKPKAIILKYNNSGVQQWLTSYAPPKTQIDHYAAGISLALYGGKAQPLVYLAAMSMRFMVQDEPRPEDWLLLKYNPAITTTSNSTLEPLGAVETIKDYQVTAAPNPFRGSTNIRFTIPIDSRITLKVYDALGREVVSLVNGFRAAGNYTIPFNADSKPGKQFFYTLTAFSTKGEFRQTKPLLLKE